MKIIFLLFTLTFTACTKTQTVCPGYERTTTGSMCRDTTTGQYVDAAKCGDC